jgi:hypothetical protein
MEDPQIHLEILELTRVLNDTSKGARNIEWAINRLCELKRQGSSEARSALMKFTDHEYGIIRTARWPVPK